MIRVKRVPVDTLAQVQQGLQMAVALEFATIPPYLYALMTLAPGTNDAARRRLKETIHEEMIHMCLACNILNAIGGCPDIPSGVPSYPGPLPGSIGSEDGEVFKVHLLPFSKPAMQQAMHIEEPEKPLIIKAMAFEAAPEFQTIGEFYASLDKALSVLPEAVWRERNQIGDQPFFAGQLFAVTSYTTAHAAIDVIISEGEGNTESPLDFEGELAHFYRFEEIYRDQILEKDPTQPTGYRWGATLGVDWGGVLPAIADPGLHDFSDDPEALSAQQDCNRAFSLMVDALNQSVNGEPGRMGNAVRFMFELRMAALAALNTPLKGLDGQVAGPAFIYDPTLI